jgi:hypothetical protein
LRSVSVGGKDRGFVIGPESRNGNGKSVGTLLNEFVSLVVEYAKEQTVDPIRGLGRYLVFGLIGAFLVAIGGGLAALAALRLIQAETGNHLRGSLTWAPYTGGFVVAGVGAAWAVLRLRRGLTKVAGAGDERGAP